MPQQHEQLMCRAGKKKNALNCMFNILSETHTFLDNQKVWISIQYLKEIKTHTSQYTTNKSHSLDLWNVILKLSSSAPAKKGLEQLAMYICVWYKKNTVHEQF